MGKAGKTRGKSSGGKGSSSNAVTYALVAAAAAVLCAVLASGGGAGEEESVSATSGGDSGGGSGGRRLGFVPFAPPAGSAAGRGAAPASPGSPVAVSLHENGDPAGTPHTFEDAAAFRRAAARHRFYTAVGEPLRKHGQLRAGMAVYRVPALKNPQGQWVQHFIWPQRPVGDRVVVTGIDTPTRAPIELEAVKDSPRVFYVHNFLSGDEADTLIARASDPTNPYSVRPSTTGHKSWTDDGGASKANTNPTRTSENGFDIDSAAALAAKRRAFQLLRIEEYDESMADGVQVLRYELGQAYIAHSDYFSTHTSADHNWDPRKAGSNRFATVFLYLSDVEEGGQTVFPRASPVLRGNETARPMPTAITEKLFPKGGWELELTKKCYSSLAITPKKGSAILFYSQTPGGGLDPMSEHGACPILKGKKWAANMWVWNACRFGQCKK